MLILLNVSVLLAKPDDINNMTWQQKSDLIQNYPVICATNFEHMVQLFIEDVLTSNLIVQLLSSKIVHFDDKRMKLCQFTIIPKTIIL